MTELTRDELLVLLCEEAAEVIQAAAKCLRFGFDTIGPGDYGRNDLALARECGQVFAIVDALDLNLELIIAGHREKIDKAEAAKAQYGVPHA